VRPTKRVARSFRGEVDPCPFRRRGRVTECPGRPVCLRPRPAERSGPAGRAGPAARSLAALCSPPLSSHAKTTTAQPRAGPGRAASRASARLSSAHGVGRLTCQGVAAPRACRRAFSAAPRRGVATSLRTAGSAALLRAASGSFPAPRRPTRRTPLARTRGAGLRAAAPCEPVPGMPPDDLHPGDLEGPANDVRLLRDLLGARPGCPQRVVIVTPGAPSPRRPARGGRVDAADLPPRAAMVS
jgi:hypothetical protein